MNRRMNHCSLCDWVNPYMSSQDGSRELAAHEHAQEHEVTP